MWFWRGTQSAIFYYVSLSPCLEYNHKRKRRKEANRSHKERAELELSEPGLIHQPVPFQTNQYWAEEIRAGPGPPRGWKKHSLDDRAKKGTSDKRKGKDRQRSVFAPTHTHQPDELSPSTSSSSDPAAPTVEQNAARPSLRASTTGAAFTLDALRDTLKSTIARPDSWNWKRYEREDETLFGINDRISRMWDRAKHHSRQASADPGQSSASARKRPCTADSDDHSWLYTRNPGVNDLHPPTVSQLPRTKREVAWMMQPPPSRAVMEGKVRPEMEHGNRRPLCNFGGTPVHPKEPDKYEDRPQLDMSGASNHIWPPKILISPDGADHTEADDEEDTDAEYEAGEEGTEATLNPDHPSSRSSSTRYSPYGDPPSSPSPPPPPALPRAHPTSPAHPSPLRRPPLAVLLDSPSPSPTSFHSYHLPVPSPKLPNARSTSPSRPRELDVLMGVVLPRMPERSRYSLPNIRLGEW